MHHPFLISKKIYLRGLEEKDLEGPYFQWLNDQEADQYTDHAMWPNTPEKMHAFFDHVRDSREDLVLAIVEKETNCHVGNVALHQINWIHRRAELAILVGELSATAKGYGTEAVTLLVDYAFRKLNLHRIALGVNAENSAAIRCYKKAGFKEEGRFADDFLRDGIYTETIRMAIVNNR